MKSAQARRVVVFTSVCANTGAMCIAASVRVVVRRACGVKRGLRSIDHTGGARASAKTGAGCFLIIRALQVAVAKVTRGRNRSPAAGTSSDGGGDYELLGFS